MCYSGEISTMVPRQPLFNGILTLIRPLVFLDEPTINRFAKDHRFPKFENPCPTAKTSKRREIKEMLNALYQTNKKIRGNIFRAMSHVKPDYLLGGEQQPGPVSYPEEGEHETEPCSADLQV
jgi:tRNA 2-thiocytidine biosynthesis protein TtcA